MAQPGFVYVLFNPSMDGMVKVGRTTLLPHIRHHAERFVQMAREEYLPSKTLFEDVRREVDRQLGGQWWRIF